MGQQQEKKKTERQKKRTEQKKKRAGRKVDLNDNPEIPDRRKASDISGLPLMEERFEHCA